MYVRLGLVSIPGLVRDATCATIASLPDVRIVVMASGALSATHHFQRLELDLVLLDANLPEDEVSALLTWLADHLPGARRVVARTTSAECDQALAFGADEAFRRDELAGKLALFIDEMSP